MIVWQTAMNEKEWHSMFRRVSFRDLVFVPTLAVLLGLAACSDRNVSEERAGSGSNATAPAASLDSAHGTAPGNAKRFGPLKMQVPAGWVEQTPASSMRKGQFALPRVEGDPADGEFVVFYFGPGQGGSAEANIDRWIGQITQPDGSSSKQKAKTSKKTIAGLAVTIVDLSGTYQPGMMPGASPEGPSAGYRMIAAVVETPQGPWFFKLVGPEKTMARWSGSFDQFLNGITQG